MPSPVVWSAGSGFYHHLGPFSDATFITTIESLPAGSFTGDAPTLVIAIAKNNSSPSTSIGAIVTLLDDTRIFFPDHPVAEGLQSSGFAFGQFDVWLLEDDRLALGGEVQVAETFFTSFSGTTSAGAAFVAAFDLSFPAVGWTVSHPTSVFIPAHSGSVDPLVFTLAGDPTPFYVVSSLGKDGLHTPSISATPGWSDIGNQQTNGATAALALYTPQSPPELTASWGDGAAGNWSTIANVLGFLPPAAPPPTLSAHATVFG